MGILESIAAVSVGAGVISTIAIAIDLRHRPQQMKIMNSVWILTGLWTGVFALPAYFWLGRAREAANGEVQSMKSMGDVKKPMRHAGSTKPNMMSMLPEMKPDGSTPCETATMKDMSMDDHMKMKSMSMNGTEMKDKRTEKMDMGRGGLRSAVLSTLHCGAGCTLADIIGEWLLYLVPVAVGGSVIFGGWIAEYILALCIGVYFQYAAIRGMQKISRGKAVKHAIKADFLSLTAWQAGMYGWMAIALLVIFAGTPLPKTSWTFWFMMQIAMMAGFVCALPVNALLIKWRIKLGM